MMTLSIIGNIGADAQIKESDGRKFITFRVAHNERYTKADGTTVDKAQWIDCNMQCQSDGTPPSVFNYLKAGQLVYLQGTMSTRIYSSEKDRCMKAGVTIHVRSCELLGSSSNDVIPRRLYTLEGLQVDITKYYNAGNYNNCLLVDQRGRRYQVDENGWITGIQEPEPNAQTDGTH